MFADGRVYNAAIEQDLGSVCDIVEDPQRVFEFIVVVVAQSLDPGFNFL